MKNEKKKWELNTEINNIDIRQRRQRRYESNQVKTK